MRVNIAVVLVGVATMVALALAPAPVRAAEADAPGAGGDAGGSGGDASGTAKDSEAVGEERSPGGDADGAASDPKAAGDAAPASEADASRALVRRVLDNAPRVPFTAKLTLSTEGGLARELELRHKRVGDADASYMEVTSPLDVKDTRFLFFERIEGQDEQFIFLPAFKRVMQVADDVRKQPFLGSEFYVSDLVAPDLAAFTYHDVGTEKVGERDCRLVEIRPKTPATELYGKAILAIDPQDLVVLRTQFFDHDQKLLKVWTIEKLEKIDGHWTPREQKMTNVQEERASHFTIREITYGADVPDDTFIRTYLMR